MSNRISKIIFVALFIANYSPVALGQEDNPDMRREKRFHEIFKKYNETPTEESAWSTASEKRKSESYSIMSGDSLWGVSETLFGDANFWPKIWSLNGEDIQNPHLIIPNNKIQFFPGTTEDVPAVEVTTGADGAPAAPTDATLAGTVAQAPKVAQNTPESEGIVVIPPPTKKYPKVLKTLPPSMPPWSMISPPEEQQKIEMALTKRIVNISAPTFLTHYLDDSSISGVGEVREVEHGGQSAGNYMYIIVHLDDPNQKQLLALREVDKVKDPNAILRSGVLIEVQGEIEVLEPVTNGSNYFRAIVKNLIAPVTVGAKLVVGGLPIVDNSPGPISSGLEARVIGGQYERTRELFGFGNLLFLDAGSTKGLQPGQVVPIYANSRVRNGRSVVDINERMIGSAKVVRVTEGFATAVVLSSTHEIQVGDKTFPNGDPGASNEEEFVSGGSVSDSGSEEAAVEAAPPEEAPAPEVEPPAEAGSEGSDEGNMDAPMEEQPPADGGGDGF